MTYMDEWEYLRKLDYAESRFDKKRASQLKDDDEHRNVSDADRSEEVF